MAGLVLKKENPLYNVYVRFHSGEIVGSVARDSAKSLLFVIHYSGAYDTTDADAEIEKRRHERRL